MIGILNPSNSVYFNLATEAFLLNHLKQGFVMVWKSSDAVVIGKHQNALAEVNLPYVFDKNIPVARRISGGGTVVHDPGNINFTIAMPIENQKLIDYKRFLNPIIQFLNSYGVKATFSGRNDLLVNDLKISGNAQHHFRKNNLILHHGTLLFNADLKNLSEAIRVDPKKYTDKAVQSNRSAVCNLLSCLNRVCSVEAFENHLQQFLFSFFACSEVRSLNDAEINSIQMLVESKFSTNAWNWGYSPAYRFSNHFEYDHCKLSINLDVSRDALIQDARIQCSDPTQEQRWHALAKALTKSFHYPDVIQALLCRFFPDSSRFHPFLFAFF